MSSQVNKAVKVLRAVAQYPSPTSGRVMKGVAGCSGVTVVSSWSQRNLERGKSIKFQQTHFVDTKQNKSSDMLPVDITSEVLSVFSNSEEKRAVVREIQSENSKKKQFLEVWTSQRLSNVFDLAALEVHGDVYSDASFGSLAWSPCEEKLLYIAEKKLPKTEPFYKQKSQETKENGTGDGKAVKGEEYDFRPDWGEQMVGRHHSVIVVCDVNSETLRVLEGVPCHLTPGQVAWTPDGQGVVGVAWETEPRRLGLIYCTNRRSYIFHLSLAGEFSVLSEENSAVRSPRFSPDGEHLVWLQRPSGGPHHAAHKLVHCRWPSRELDVVVDIVRQRAPTTGGAPFYGIYCSDLPKRCWSADSSRLIFNSPQKCCVKSYVVNLESKSLTELECADGSQVVLDMWNDKVLCSRSSYKQPSRLFLSQLSSIGSEQQMSWVPVTNWNIDASLNNLVYHCMNLTRDDDAKSACKSFTAIYFGPESSVEHEVPLIVWPHGGPHSAFMNDFSMYFAFFGLLGYGMLLVNYRGSIGAGQDSVEFLPGRVGDTDVKDVHFATMEALKQFSFLNPNKLVLFGGSHGGFLVTHMSGQYPDLFKAVVARNAVTDIAAMATITDIPDWNAVEAGYPYLETSEMSLEAFEKMKKCSPISHVSKVTAPTLVMVGSQDKRVPGSQGIHYYYRLKAQNVKTKLLLYEDNHPLGQTPVEVDVLINSVLWFNQHLE